MIRVSIKINSESHKTECFEVDHIFAGFVSDSNKVVLHFAATEPFIKLLNISLKYGWELYKYAEDNHVGLTVNGDEIYHVEYLD